MFTSLKIAPALFRFISLIFWICIIFFCLLSSIIIFFTYSSAFTIYPLKELTIPIMHIIITNPLQTHDTNIKKKLQIYLKYKCILNTYPRVSATIIYLPGFDSFQDIQILAWMLQKHITPCKLSSMKLFLLELIL